MRETTLQLLANLLQENVGNKVTASLATGILSMLNQELLRMEPKPEASAQKVDIPETEGAVPA